MSFTIAIDARFVTRDLSGIGRYTLNLLHGVGALEPKVPFLVLRSSATPIPESLLGLKCFEFVDVGSSPWRISSQWALASFLESRHVSLLHSTDVFGPLRGKFKRVITLHDMIPITCRNIGPRSRKSQVWWAWRWWLKLQCARADAVLTDSQASKRDIFGKLFLDRSLAGRASDVLGPTCNMGPLKCPRRHLGARGRGPPSPRVGRRKFNGLSRNGGPRFRGLGRPRPRAPIAKPRPRAPDGT